MSGDRSGGPEGPSEAGFLRELNRELAGHRRRVRGRRPGPEAAGAFAELVGLAIRVAKRGRAADGEAYASFVALRDRLRALDPGPRASPRPAPRRRPDRAAGLAAGLRGHVARLGEGRAAALLGVRVADLPGMLEGRVEPPPAGVRRLRAAEPD